MADFAVGAARDLPLNQTASWDGGEATQAIFAWAGGDEFDAAKARRAFLAYDKSAADQRGSYKLPFARPIDGELTAVRAGLNNAASRLSQTSIPQAVKDRARAVIDGYQEKYKSSPEPLALRDRPLETYDHVTRQDDEITLIPLELRAAAADDPLAGVPGYDGYFCTFNTVDHHGTFFTPGAFKKTLKERAKTAPVLWHHEPSMPIGRHESIIEDEHGVFARTRLIEGVQAADEALALLRGGVALGLSFGFKTTRDRAATERDELDFSVAPEWARDVPRDQIRAITEVDLWESSPVTFASNEKAAPSKVRALEERSLLAALLAKIEADELDPTQERMARQLAEAWSARAAAGIPDTGDDHRTRTPERQREIDLSAALIRFRHLNLLRGDLPG